MTGVRLTAAAWESAADIVEAYVEHVRENGVVHVVDRTTPVGAALAGQFQSRLDHGDLEWCAHAVTGEQPGLWLPMLPSTVRCAACVQFALALVPPLVAAMSVFAPQRVRECRVCGVPGGDELTEVTVPLGAVVVLAEVCHQCRNAER